jgi:1-acyl-sn-glycerol-3-phosphate acyltransferase
MQWLRSLAFVIQMYAMMAAMGLVYLPLAALDRRHAHAGVRNYARWVRWTARRMVGIESEVRGEVPTGEVLIAAKHQSFLDIIIMISVLERPRFIMKASLRYAPVLGWFALRIGCIPVERGRRAEAIAQMRRGVASGRVDPGQLIIYPQGTRVAPGAWLPYKVGASVLYGELGQPCVPAATNVGVFWPRTGILRRPGRAVVQFLEPIPPGRPPKDVLAEIERRVEEASDRLMAEAGHAAPPAPRVTAS